MLTDFLLTCLGGQLFIVPVDAVKSVAQSKVSKRLCEVVCRTRTPIVDAAEKNMKRSNRCRLPQRNMETSLIEYEYDHSREWLNVLAKVLETLCHTNHLKFAGG